MLVEIQRPDTIIRYVHDSRAYENEGLNRRVESFVDSSKNILASGKEIYPQITHEILEELYNVRCEAIKALENEDFSEIFQEITSDFFGNKNQNMAILNENILFAFRCLQKVEKALSYKHKNDLEFQQFLKKDFESPTYSEIINTLFAIAHDNDSILTIRLLNATLYIEFVIIASYLIKDNLVIVTNQIINELSRIIANASHDYIAYAHELKYLSFKSSKNMNLISNVSEEFILEQKELAEAGIQDWASNLDK
jgi:hypothetical protein